MRRTMAWAQGSRTLSSFLFALLLSSGLSQPVAAAPAPPPAIPTYQGPDTVEVDLLRAGKEPVARTRIFVQALLPDGERGLFMVDTGASISALSEKTATRLGLSIEKNWGSVEGLGGRAPFHRAVLPTLQIGDIHLENVDMAVDVAGMPETAGWMPLDGILGNNVWSQFVMEIDYPADKLALHRPGTWKLPKNAQPMLFEGNAVYTSITIETESTPAQEGTLVVQIDTGASELMLSGPKVLPFETTTDVYTQGVEPVYGIGAADTLPPSVFLRETRRIPLDSVTLGGKEVEVDWSARWLNYTPGLEVGPRGLAGLAGHELMAPYVTVFDFQGSRFSLTKSKRRARKIDGHEVLLAQDLEKYGDNPSRYLFRAKMFAAKQDWKEASRLLESFLSKASDAPPKDLGEATVLLAAMRRLDGDLPGAWKALQGMSPSDLVQQGEIIAATNGLLLDGHGADALTLANAAIEAYTEASVGEDYDVRTAADGHVAKADVLFAEKKFEEANGELLLSAEILDNPDAQLLRRARIALASGDRFGAMAHIRRLLQLYPSNGQYLWFYATLLQDPGDQDVFRADLDAAMARLHPTDLPLDYLVQSYHLIGDQDEAEKRMHQGIERDCSKAPDVPSLNNCQAWYYAMGGVEPDKSLALITKAIAADPHRSDFLDTKAMVHLARREYDLAHQAAVAAARLSPDEVYMLWQAERIGQMATAHP